MEYRIEIYDDAGRRIAWYEDVALLEAVRRWPSDADTVEGLLPAELDAIGAGWRVRVYVDGKLFCDTAVTETAPQWSDTRKLILDKYVAFHELIAFEAKRPRDAFSTNVRQAYQNRAVSAVVRDVINRAPGPVHYGVDHASYPDGAEREYTKFTARKMASNELEVGGIDEGQWVGANRIDATNAFAKDGDTIAGLKVDGEAWPDLRLMLIDAEETALNSHAVSRHPDVEGWTSDRYDRSGYKVRADAAKDFLQELIDTKGIEYIELNPHRDVNGDFDDRVDAFGRYLGLVFGGGECFNAGLVENGLADVFLYQDGKFLVPEMELKDFFSYRGQSDPSIGESAAVLTEFDVDGALFEVLTALAYAAGGYIWSVSPLGTVTFRAAQRPDHVTFFQRHRTGVTYGNDEDSVVNHLVVHGSPEIDALDKSYVNGDSADRFGLRTRFLDYFSINREPDADLLAEGLLDDLAYPAIVGEAVYFQGDASLQVGDVVAFRDGELRRVDPALENEWGNRFPGELVGRIREVAHRFTGRHVETRAVFTSPLRSVENPVSYITRSQPPMGTLFQFRLDEDAVGLDLGYHLD